MSNKIDEDTKGMRELQRIQGERLTKWEANTMPIELPPSLQAAKDAARPTHRDCRFFQRLEFQTCHECTAPAPIWAYGGEEALPLPRRVNPGDDASDCECFEQKDANADP